MWSLKDLRRGARRGRAITWASGSPIPPQMASAQCWLGDHPAALLPCPPVPRWRRGLGSAGRGHQARAAQDAGIAARTAAPGSARRGRPPGPRPSARRGHIWKGLGPAGDTLAPLQPRPCYLEASSFLCNPITWLGTCRAVLLLKNMPLLDGQRKVQLYTTFKVNR
jgi:hypothetical protein